MERKSFLVLAVLAGLALVAAGTVTLGLAQEPEPTEASPSVSETVVPDEASSSSVSPPQDVSAEARRSSAPVRLDAGPSSVGPREGPKMEDSGPSVDSPQLASLRVVGSALRPRESAASYTVGGGGGCIYVTSGDNEIIWNTPVYLPQGAEVQALRMYYDDTSTAEDCSGFFTVYDLYGNVEDEWWVASSGSGGKNYSTSEQFSHTIDYNLYSYVLNWRPWETGSDMQLCGFRVFYEPPPFGLSFLPLTMKNHSP